MPTLNSAPEKRVPRTPKKPEVESSDIYNDDYKAPGYKKFRKVFAQSTKPDQFLTPFPTKISHIADAQLGDMQALYSAWREFTQDLLTSALQAMMARKSEYDYEFAKAVIIAPGDGINEKKFTATADDKLKAKRASLLDAEIYFEMLSKKLESVNECLVVLSREVTRRGYQP